MVVIDVLNDAGGRELLFNKYGIRKVPVLAKGEQYAMGQMLEPFAKLAGISLSKLGGLTPEQLYKKYEMVLAAGQRYARQFPQERFRERVIPHRDRAIRTLCYHIFRIGESFLETWDGAEYGVKIADNEPPEALQTGDDVARRVFERCTWHSAQHCRQLVAVLERMDIKADRPLTPEDLAGLPLPERLWE
jgi:hypothetical protein